MAHSASEKPDKRIHLRRGKLPGSRHRTVSPKVRLFCMAYVSGMSARQAALEAGFRPKTSWDLLRRDEVKKCLAELDAAAYEELIKEVKTQVRCSVNILDETLKYVADNWEHIKKMKGADVVQMLKVGYQRFGLIESRSVNVGQAQGMLAGQNANAFEVYKSAWLRRKEEGWQKQLEGEVQ